MILIINDAWVEEHYGSSSNSNPDDIFGDILDHALNYQYHGPVMGQQQEDLI